MEQSQQSDWVGIDRARDQQVEIRYRLVSASIERPYRREQDLDDPEHQRFVVLGPPTGIVTLDGGYGRFKVVLDGENNDRVLRPIKDAVQSARLVSVDDAIEKLNALVHHAPDALHQLCETRFVVEGADAPFFTSASGASGETLLGLLGVLNALFGPQPRDGKRPGWGYIAADYDDDTEQLVGFSRADR